MNIFSLSYNHYKFSKSIQGKPWHIIYTEIHTFTNSAGTSADPMHITLQ